MNTKSALAAWSSGIVFAYQTKEELGGRSLANSFRATF
jgi:hypothetical protein